jgi:hypothetical protein
MLDHSPASPSAIRRPLCALAWLGVLVLGGGQADALPPVQVKPAPGFLLVQGGPPGSERRAQEDRQAPLSDLNEVLGATRAKLEELTEATALVVAGTEWRNELQALKADNERLAAELEQASARRAELERAAKLAEARIAELTKAADAARREAARLNEGSAELRQQNERLNQNLARADAAREAALAEAEDIRADTAEKLGATADEVEQLRAELADSRDKLEARRQELAEANGAREQVEARMIALQEVVERSGAEAERLERELAEAKAQLDQAAGAAVAAERARQAAGGEAEALRGEAERAREELAAARDESGRLRAANAEMEKQIASLYMDWRTATETARHNLIVMEEKIEELNAALDRARPEAAPPTDGSEVKPEAIENEADAPSQAPSAMLQPPAPDADGGTDAEQPAKSTITLPVIGVTAARAESVPFETATVALEKLIGSLPDASPATGNRRHEPIMTDAEIKAALADTLRAKQAALGDERETASRTALVVQSPAPEPAGDHNADQAAGSATRLAMVDPAAAPAEEDSGLASFRANLETLNQLERNSDGADLFSGVQSVSGREVSVSATTAWDSLPRVGRQSYLDYLLDAWVAALGGEGSAAVRIVDPSGQMLVQKSRP